MHTAIQQYSESIGITPTELLLIARRVSGEDVRHIEDLTDGALMELLDEVLRVEMVR